MKNELQIISQDNEKFVPIKTICTQLGINYTTQLERIKNDPIMGSVIPLRGTTGADGKRYEMACIPFKYAFMWLSKINPQNVEPEAREGLVAAQSKAYDLLWDSLISYQNYVEYRNSMIEEQEIVRKQCRADFSQAKSRLKDAEDELERRLAVKFQDYLNENSQLQIEFIEESEVK